MWSRAPGRRSSPLFQITECTPLKWTCPQGGHIENSSSAVKCYITLLLFIHEMQSFRNFCGMAYFNFTLSCYDKAFVFTDYVVSQATSNVCFSSHGSNFCLCAHVLKSTPSLCFMPHALLIHSGLLSLSAIHALHVLDLLLLPT